MGGSYAVGKYLAEKLILDISELSFEKLQSKEVKEKLEVILRLLPQLMEIMEEELLGLQTSSDKNRLYICQKGLQK